jgi:nitric oxide reductase subunit B
VVVNAQPYFGLLAIGLIYFCLRYALAGRARFSETIGLAAFWLYNGGLARISQTG